MREFFEFLNIFCGCGASCLVLLVLLEVLEILSETTLTFTKGVGMVFLILYWASVGILYNL